MHDPPPGLTCFGLHHRISRSRSGGEHVAVLGHHIPVAAQHRRPLVGQQRAGVRAEALHPFELVIELLGSDRVAVGQIERADDQPLHLRLDVAAVTVVGVAWKADAPQLGRIAPSEDRHPVEPLLPVPHGAVARRLDVGDRQRLVGALQLLQAGDVGLLPLEPFEQARHPRANAVDVIGGELHARPLSGGGSSGEAAVPIAEKSAVSAERPSRSRSRSLPVTRKQSFVQRQRLTT